MSAAAQALAGPAAPLLLQLLLVVVLLLPQGPAPWLRGGAGAGAQGAAVLAGAGAGARWDPLHPRCCWTSGCAPCIQAPHRSGHWSSRRWGRGCCCLRGVLVEM